MINATVTGKIRKIQQSFNDEQSIVWIEVRDWSKATGETIDEWAVVVSKAELERRKAIIAEGKYVGFTVFRISATIDQPKDGADNFAFVIAYASKAFIL